MTSTAADLTKLRDTVTGQVLLPGDDGYGPARTVHNGAIDNHPAVIAQPVDAAGVAATITFARNNDLSVSVKGGGHGVQGHATAGDVVIDLSAMRSVTVDRGPKTATVGGGARWVDVDVPALDAGLAVPGGRITHTGVAGLTLGGGEGWLSPRWGLTIDNLLGCELVTADGRILSVDAQSEPELFWALRGGGGNFGVVTEFRFQLHELGPVVLGGMLIFPLGMLPQVAAVMDELDAADRDEWGGAMVALSAPPLPFVPEAVVGKPVVAVVPAWCGDIDEGMGFIAPLKALGPAVDLAMPVPYTALQAQIDEGNPDGMRNYWSAIMARTSPSQVLDTVMAAAEAFPTPFNNIIMSPIAGALTRVPLEDTAFPMREKGWFFHPLGRGADPTTDDAVKAWTKDLTAKLKSLEVSTYLNLESDDSATRLGEAFGDTRLARLRAVKRSWDPDNVFRHCANIAP